MAAMEFSPHFIGVPCLIATVQHPLATTFAATCDLQVLEPPIESPLIEVEQMWHRRLDRSPRLVRLRALIASICRNKPHLQRQEVDRCLRKPVFFCG